MDENEFIAGGQMIWQGQGLTVFVSYHADLSRSSRWVRISAEVLLILVPLHHTTIASHDDRDASH